MNLDALEDISLLDPVKESKVEVNLKKVILKSLETVEYTIRTNLVKKLVKED